MSNIPTDLKYTRSHEWLRVGVDGSVSLGISDHAQQALGDLVYVELPEVGRRLAAGDACAVVESVKAASDVYAPVAGIVVAVNDRLAESPELINQDPYGEGWILKLRPDAAASGEALLGAAEYADVAAGE